MQRTAEVLPGTNRVHFAKALRALSCLVAAGWILAGGAERGAWGQGVEKGAIGVGLIVGEPTGVSAKLYLSDSTAIDGAAGLAVVGGGVHIHGDFLWHPLILEEREMFVLPVYAGAGLRLFDRDRAGDNDFHMGIRAVGGLLFDFKEIPLDVFAEVAGVLDYVFAAEDQNDGVKLGLNLGVGARYYF